MQRSRRRVQSPLSKHYLHPNRPQPEKVLKPIPISQNKSKKHPQVKPLKLYKPINNIINQMFLQYPGGVYQGECIRNTEKNEEQYLRHGEGILLLASGYLVIARWNYDTIDGDCIIFIPSGGVMTCEMINSKIVGWAVTIGVEKSILCEQYHLDNSKGRSLVYSTINQCWTIHDKKSVESVFMEYGKVPPMVDQKLAAKLNRLFKGQIVPDHWQTIKKVDLNIEGSIYVGYLDEHYGYPQGLGSLLSSKQMYMGMFEQGLLHQYGRIVYKNGDSYQGGMKMGECFGTGNYYNLLYDETVEYYVDKERVEIGKTVRGNIVDSQIMVKFGNLEMKKPVQISAPVENMAERMRMLSSLYIKYQESDSHKATGSPSPHHSAPQVDHQIEHSEPKYERKLTMSPTISRVPSKPGKTLQETHEAVEQKPEKDLLKMGKEKEQNEDAMTFMKRVTEDLQKRLNDVPTVEKEHRKVSSAKRRHRIFGGK